MILFSHFSFYSNISSSSSFLFNIIISETFGAVYPRNVILGLNKLWLKYEANILINYIAAGPRLVDQTRTYTAAASAISFLRYCVSCAIAFPALATACITLWDIKCKPFKWALCCLFKVCLYKWSNLRPMEAMDYLSRKIGPIIEGTTEWVAAQLSNRCK